MKLMICVILSFGCMAYGTYIENTVEKLKDENSQLRRERDKAFSLYRTANTNLIHFQDSVNKYCICH